MANQIQSNESSQQDDEAVSATLAIRDAYALIAAAWSYPDDRQLEMIRDGLLREDLQDVLAEMPTPPDDEAYCGAPPFAEPVQWQALQDVGGDDALQTEYTRLFTTGSGCQLNGGHFCGPRMKTMEESMRFYNHFGFTMTQDAPQLPDHLSTQLEFLQVLAFVEAELVSAGEPEEHVRRARRDFIARQPGRWLPQLLEKLQTMKSMPYFVELAKLSIALMEIDYQCLSTQVGAYTPMVDKDQIPVTELNH